MIPTTFSAFGRLVMRFSSLILTLSLSAFSLPALAGDMPPAPNSVPPAEAAPAPDAPENEVPAQESSPDVGASASVGAGFNTNPQPEPEPSSVAEPTPEEAGEESSPTSETPPPENVGDFVHRPKDRLVYTNIVAARYNPLGLENRLWIGWQHRLTDKTDPLWNQANFAIFLNPIVAPALARVGATVQLQPLSILRLRATYGWFPWFGNFQYMASFDSPHDDHGPTDLNEGRDADQNYSTQGHQVELDALFQIKVKKFALRNDTQAFWNKMRLKGNDDVFYDIRIDALVPNGGWSLVNDTDALFVTDIGLAVGVRGTATKAFFPDRVYEEGDDRKDPNGAMYRVGPMIAYTFFDRPGSKFNKPTVVAIPQWNVLHRYRTGQDTHAAIPTLILAFGFGGELMSFGE
jgi:hypothetical protein